MLQDEYSIVVGIHFGISSTACCYSFVDKEASIETIKNWPKQSIRETSLSTAISYSDLYKTYTGFGNTEQTSSATVVRDLPYLLINTHPLNDINSLSIDEKHKHVDEETSIKIVSDYLKAINLHIFKRFDLLKYRNLDKIRYCFTLQFSDTTDTNQIAISNHQMYKQNLYKAIKQSGIYREGIDRRDKVEFVDTYLAMAKFLVKTKKGFEPNDEFIICNIDATYLNLRSMKVTGVSKAISIVEGPLNETANDLGGRNIDHKFREYIEPVLKAYAAYQNIDVDHLNSVREASVDYFIKFIKYNLDFDSDKEIGLRVSSNGPSSRSFPNILLNANDLQINVFDPIIDKIVHKINTNCETYQNNPIFLCGKMSKSLYLQAKLFSKQKNIIVIPDDQAPAQGAVYHGLAEKLSIQRYAPIALDHEVISKNIDSSYYDFNYDIYTHIIGIDFGTNYSKWCIFSKKDEDYVAFKSSEVICPTLALYDERRQKQKYWGDEAFGKYYIEPGEPGELFNRFKLFLDETKKSAFNEETAIRIISNYLNGLNKFILHCMNRQYPDEDRRYRYCLTVPIIWDERLKKIMREAAILANLIDRKDHPCRLMLVSEPEAAAAFYSDTGALQNFKDNQRIRAIICDAGGGTVDIATYEYYKNDKDSDYSIDEVTQSTGDVCGSSFLEDNYRQLLARKFEENKLNVHRYDNELLIKDFTFGSKVEFGKDSGEVVLTVPVLKDAKKVTETIKIQPQEMRTQVFEPTIKKVIALVKTQIEMSEKLKKRIDMIILTGGFGQSKFLKEKVIELSTARNIQVYQPTEYDLSVVKGAAKIANKPSIICHRTAQQTYGIEVMVPYNSSKHMITNRLGLHTASFSQLEFDKLMDVGTIIPIYQYCEKRYYIEYPHNTFIALYSTTVENRSSSSTIHPDMKELVRYLINTPVLENRKEGDLIPFKIQIYFGQFEVKIDSTFDDKTITRVSFPFVEDDEVKRIEVERLHHTIKPTT